MKVLLLAGKMENGGAETHIFELASGLIKRGHSVTLASSGGRCARELEKKGVSCATLIMHKRSLIALMRAYAGLYRLISEESFQIVHAHTRLTAFLAHGICKRKGVPLVTTAHAKFRMGMATDVLSKWGEATVAVSQDIKQHLVRQGKVYADNVTVIPNGIDTDLFSPNGRETEPKICFLSRLDSDCSATAYALCRIAADVAQRYEGVRIFIGGDGEELSGVRQAAEAVNRQTEKETVTVVGRVICVPEFLRGATVFVGVSRAALEAMS